MAALLVLVAGACAGGGESSLSSPTPSATTSSPSPTPFPTCGPSSKSLELVAEKDPSSATAYAFDKECLAAPADTRFTIRFDNRDADTHNVHILDRPGGDSLFEGEIITGPKVVTYKVGPLPAGEYYFRCDIHPLRMNGELLVGG